MLLDLSATTLETKGNGAIPQKKWKEKLFPI